jgi:prepilin-type N-terminal cleavage/methylation domain-containing protein
MLRTGKMIRRAPNNKPAEIGTSLGFTLIELAIVASLIAVLIAVSTPLFRTTYRALELKDSAYNIAKMIRYASASAVMEEKRYKIVFDFEKRAYWLLKESEKGSEKEFEKVRGRFGNKFYLPKGILLTSDKNELVFLPNGRSTKATVSVMDKAKKKGFDINAAGKAGQAEILDVKEE